MNREIFQWTPQSVPADWTRVRNQREYSHIARFVLQLIGFGAFLLSALVETPAEDRLRNRITPEAAQLAKR